MAPSDRNPVFQQLRISLADSEATLASARAKLAGYEAQYKALKAQAQLVPQIEAEFAQLNRDYDVQRKTYESLLARRESATMGKDVQDSGGARFRVIDPPRVSPSRWRHAGSCCSLSRWSRRWRLALPQLLRARSCRSSTTAVRSARCRSVPSLAWCRSCRAIAGYAHGVATPIYLQADSAASWPRSGRCSPSPC